MAIEVDGDHDFFLLYDYDLEEINPIKYVQFNVSDRSVDLRACSEFVYIDDDQKAIKKTIRSLFSNLIIFRSIFELPRYLDI